MSDKDENKNVPVRQLALDHHVKLSTETELRKNVNVLNTAGSENSALNPFLQNQGTTTQGNQQSSPNTTQENSGSKK